ncbi:MAG: hypothetical protein ACK5KO_04175 [Arachnia sp.]
MTYEINPHMCRRIIDEAAQEVDEFDQYFTQLGSAVVEAESALGTENELCRSLPSALSSVFTGLIDQAYFASKDNAKEVLERAGAALDAFDEASKAMSHITRGINAEMAFLRSDMAFRRNELAVARLGQPSYSDQEAAQE